MFSISGLVIPTEWDQQGNVINFAIATRDEEEYILEGHTHRVSLRPLLRQEVEVSGVLEKKGGKKIIKVKKIIKKNIHQ